MIIKTIAILGLGKMGFRMANNYIDAGYIVHIWNRSDINVLNLLSKGAKKYSTIKETVKGVDVVITMLRDDKASKEVWLNHENGVINFINNNTIAVECSTISTPCANTLDLAFKERKISFLTAPVIGSLPQAETKQLIHLIGGRKEIFKQLEKILLSNASVSHHVGKVEDATSLKLAVNGIFGMQITALAETLGLLENQGILKEKAVSILNKLPITSPALQGAGLAMVHENYDPLFPIDLVEKDFAYLSEMLSTKEDLDSPIKTTHQLYKKAKEDGYANDNIAGVAQLF